jgi:hypothetical protein
VREIVGTSPSVNIERADRPTYQGGTEVSADDPVVGAEGDSSFTSIVYRETLSTASVHQTRVLDSRLFAGTTSSPFAIDDLTTPGTTSADQPGVGTTQTGTGWLTSEQTTSHNLYGDWLRGAEYPTTPVQLNTQYNAGAPYAAPAAAGNVAMVIPWQQASGIGAAADIRLRYAPDGNNLGAEEVVSTPALGSTNAALGLFAGGDGDGDAAVAWVQGSGASTRIVARQLFQNPGSFSPYSLFSYSRTRHPTLTWSSALEQWGPIRYVVKLDGRAVTQTDATSARVPTLVGQGRHSWRVTAYNLAGEAVSDRQSTVFVDSLAPRVTVKVTGARHPHVQLRVTVKPTDAPRGLPAADGSGVASISVRWGDGKRATIKRTSAHKTALHAYGRRGKFKLQVIVTDRAGNRKVVTRTIKITRASRSGPHGRHHGVRRPRGAQ